MRINDVEERAVRASVDLVSKNNTPKRFYPVAKKNLDGSGSRELGDKLLA